jgi:hypothetical protein
MKNNSGIVIYQTADNQTPINIRFEYETVWQTQILVSI